MPSLINGCGTAYYGCRNEQSDGSFVTTEFFVFLYFPLVPLHSWRIRPVGPASDFYSRRWLSTFELSKQEYEVDREAFDLQQALSIYFAAFLKIAAIALGVIIFFAGTLLLTLSIFDLAESTLWGSVTQTLMTIGAAGLLYWVLLGRRPRRFERIVFYGEE